QWALQIDLLGGHVEVINGRLAGRLQAGVRFQGERLSPARLLGLLAQLGITAEILESAPLLREAVCNRQSSVRIPPGAKSLRCC
ncbi:hypothetical protein NL457_29080, partial [Klebsiella pneumoniae]|nr:hypothetical protein [Klebsiella pneumoniae]